jgi:hypothetical protein
VWVWVGGIRRSEQFSQPSWGLFVLELYRLCNEPDLDVGGEEERA